MKRNDGFPLTKQTFSKESKKVRRMDYTLAELKALPTISTGQADDLKIDTGDVRVWLSRCSVEDGEPFNNKVTVEVYNARLKKWLEARKYEAK